MSEEVKQPTTEESRELTNYWRVQIDTVFCLFDFLLLNFDTKTMAILTRLNIYT